MFIPIPLRIGTNFVFLCRLVDSSKKGLNGFDSGLNGYASMPSVVIWLVNLGLQTITGESNYALAA